MRAVATAGAQGVIVLMVRVLRAAHALLPRAAQGLDERGVPHLLIETEHEGLPVETVQTRVERSWNASGALQPSPRG